MQKKTIPGIYHIGEMIKIYQTWSLQRKNLKNNGAIIWIQKVAELLRGTEEINIFLRGYISWIGFKQCKIIYKPASRHAGITKYNPRKMFNLALNGITSFSVKPLRFSIIFGVTVSALGFLYAFYAIIITIFTDKTIPGWSSILVSVLLLGGIQLFVLGIIGEYLGKIFLQTKHRPDFIVNKVLN